MSIFIYYILYILYIIIIIQVFKKNLKVKKRTFVRLKHVKHFKVHRHEACSLEIFFKKSLLLYFKKSLPLLINLSNLGFLSNYNLQ